MVDGDRDVVPGKDCQRDVVDFHGVSPPLGQEGKTGMKGSGGGIGDGGATASATIHRAAGAWRRLSRLSLEPSGAGDASSTRRGPPYLRGRVGNHPCGGGNAPVGHLMVARYPDQVEPANLRRPDLPGIDLAGITGPSGEQGNGTVVTAQPVLLDDDALGAPDRGQCRRQFIAGFRKRP